MTVSKSQNLCNHWHRSRTWCHSSNSKPRNYTLYCLV